MVERKIERPVYREVVEEVQVPFDQIIEQEYEVLVPNVIKVEVEKEYKVPV